MSSHLPPGLVDAIREFTASIRNPYDAQELLHRLTVHAMTITGAQGAGIMLAGASGDLGFAAASHERVTELELLQGRIDSGACQAAYATNRIVVVDDLASVDSWPEYNKRALANGFRAVLGVPMHASGQTIGVLNVYRETARPWTAMEVESVEILTAIGSAYILHGTELRAQYTLAEQLQEALQSRDLIGQAKGILMARHQIDADAAFDLLRERSQSLNRKLRDVAQELVAGERSDANA